MWKSRLLRSGAAVLAAMTIVAAVAPSSGASNEQHRQLSSDAVVRELFFNEGNLGRLLRHGLGVKTGRLTPVDELHQRALADRTNAVLDSRYRPVVEPLMAGLHSGDPTTVFASLLRLGHLVVQVMKDDLHVAAVRSANPDPVINGEILVNVAAVLNAVVVINVAFVYNNAAAIDAVVVTANSINAAFVRPVQTNCVCVNSATAGTRIVKCNVPGSGGNPCSPPCCAPQGSIEAATERRKYQNAIDEMTGHPSSGAALAGPDDFRTAATMLSQSPRLLKAIMGLTSALRTSAA
jgi:hypothetical protein